MAAMRIRSIRPLQAGLLAAALAVAGSLTPLDGNTRAQVVVGGAPSGVTVNLGVLQDLGPPRNPNIPWPPTSPTAAPPLAPPAPAAPVVPPTLANAPPRPVAPPTPVAPPQQIVPPPTAAPAPAPRPPATASAPPAVQAAPPPSPPADPAPPPASPPAAEAQPTPPVSTPPVTTRPLTTPPAPQAATPGPTTPTGPTITEGPPAGSTPPAPTVSDAAPSPAPQSAGQDESPTGDGASESASSSDVATAAPPAGADAGASLPPPAPPTGTAGGGDTLPPLREADRPLTQPPSLALPPGQTPADAAPDAVIAGALSPLDEDDATAPQAAAGQPPGPGETIGQIPDMPGYRLLFAAGSDELSTAAGSLLNGLAQRLIDNPEETIQVRAYAQSSVDRGSDARRLSLNRALVIRTFLLDRGIRSTRIDIRALGDTAEGEPRDRVDLVFTN